MKQKLLKTWLMLVLMLVGAGTTWADADVAFTFSDQGYTNGQVITSGKIDSYTSWSATKGGSNDPAYYTTGTGLRVYNGGKFSITSSKTIASITLTFSASGYTFSTSNTTTPQTVEPNTTSYSWDVSRTSRLQKIEITYASSGGSTPSHMAYFYVNGTLQNEGGTSYAEGASIKFPDDPSDINGKNFVGWTTIKDYSNATTAPSDMTKSTTMGNDDVTYYAVFASGGSTTSSVNISDYAAANSWQGNGAMAYKSITLDENITVSTTGTGNNGKYYSDWRLYQSGNGNIIVTAKSGCTLTSAKFTFTVSNTGDLKYGNSSVQSGKSVKISGSSTSATFDVGNTGTATNGQVRVTAIEVVYLSSYFDYCTTVGEAEPELTLIAIEATGSPAEFWKGDAFNHDGITVTALWEDETETDVTSSCEFSGYDMSTAGQQTVTVKYQGETCTYGIEVKTIANTQETAYTVAEAKALIDAGKDLATQVYVAGTVSSLGANKDGENAYNETYKSITYWLDENTFEVYSGKNLNNTDFSSAEELIVGDQVVIYGVIKKYSSIYEFDKNNYIVSLTHPAAKTIKALEISGTPTKTTYNVGDAFETAGLTVTATYSDASTATITTGFDWEIDYGTGNEALVAGATSVDVMVYTEDDVMSEVFTVNGLTVNVPVTLTSIAVSGTPTKTEYYAGDAFETAGLVVTGTYSDSHQETITEGIEWTVDPETLALETTSVDVMAGVGSVVSDVYTVNGLTVTKPDFETATYNFSTFTSGATVELTDFDGFVITLKSNGGTNPAWNSGASEARVYAKGSLTIKANNAIIKSIEYEYTVNANSKGVTPTIDGVAGSTTVGTWDVENKTWTGADEEVTFSTSGTAGNIGFTKLIIKYVESSKITPTLSFSAPTAEVTIGADDNEFPTLTTDPAELEGVTYESSNTAVATIDENTGAITLIAAGETTITAKYAGNEDYAAATPASYTLTVSKAPFVPTPVAEGYEDVDFTTVEPYKSLATNGSAEMTTYEGTSFSAEFAKKSGTNNAPKFYQNGNAVRAYVDNTITITAAEPIYNVNMAWVNGYVDDAVSITGLGTTTAVVTFSKTCRFTDITVYYQQYTRSLANAWGTICLPYDFKADATTTYYSIASVQMENDNPVAMALTKETELKAGVPYIFCSKDTEAGLTCVRAGKEIATEPASVNGMTGSFDKHEIAAGMYLLSGNKFVKVAEGSKVGENRAYIDMSKVPAASAGVKADVIFGFNGDITDGIMAVESNERNAQYVDLSGRRVMNPVKGLYIVNGKKVMIKK